MPDGVFLITGASSGIGEQTARRAVEAGYREGSLAICGFGPPAAEPSPFDPAFEPYTPSR